MSIPQESTTITDAFLEELWETFGQIPMDEDEYMEGTLGEQGDPWYFPAGTHREKIWHYFDEEHSRGVVYLLYHTYSRVS